MSIGQTCLLGVGVRLRLKGGISVGMAVPSVSVSSRLIAGVTAVFTFDSHGGW